LGVLLVSGATSIINAASKPGRHMTDWLRALLLRKPRKLVAVALANKMARVAWAIMKHGGTWRRSAAARPVFRHITIWSGIMPRPLIGATPMTGAERQAR
jgi:hypothetical protein